MNPVWVWPDGDVPAAAAALSTAGDRPDVQAVAQPPDDAGARLRVAAPVVVPVDGGLLCVASARRRRARLTVPSGATVGVPTNVVTAAITAHEAAATPPSSWWVVRSSPGTSFWQQCRQAGVHRQLVFFVAAHAAHYGLFLWSWAVLGRAAFAGDVDGGALLRWGLLLAATVPARLAATRLQTQVAIGAGWLLRRRLLHGTLKLRPIRNNVQLDTRNLKLVVQARNIERIALGGSGAIEVQRLRAPKLEVNLGGSGTITIGQVEADALAVSLGGSGKLKAGGGAVRRVSVSIGGSGDVELGQVSCDEASVNVAGSGNATVWARNALSVSIAGSGDVNYYGDPQVSKTVIGSGSTRRLGGAPR